MASTSMALRPVNSNDEFAEMHGEVSYAELRLIQTGPGRPSDPTPVVIIDKRKNTSSTKKSPTQIATAASTHTLRRVNVTNSA